MFWVSVALVPLMSALPCSFPIKSSVRPEINGECSLRKSGEALMSDSGGPCLVDEASSGEAPQVEGAADLVMRAGREKPREQRSAGGNRLEAAGSPASIQENPWRGRGSDDRRGVGDDINDSAPLPHELQLAEGRKHVEKAGNNDFLHGRRAALVVGGNAVEAAAEHDLAFIR